jgi:3-hydroxybutyryl-CoA dehydratase
MENSYTQVFSYTQNQVDEFAELVGDKNPIHLDEAYAAKTIFGKRIVHGFLGGSVFSKIFGMHYPGEGTIYLKQELKFLAPMYAGENYTAVVEIQEIFHDKNRARVRTTVRDSSGKNVIDGEALIQNNLFKR